MLFCVQIVEVRSKPSRSLNLLLLSEQRFRTLEISLSLREFMRKTTRLTSKIFNLSFSILDVVLDELLDVVHCYWNY